VIVSDFPEFQVFQNFWRLPHLEFPKILESSCIMVSSLSDIDTFLLIVNKLLSPGLERNNLPETTLSPCQTAGRSAADWKGSAVERLVFIGTNKC
jgi:hypothetical protein